MENFSYEINDAVARVTFDSGAMNTLKADAIKELGELLAKLDSAHAGAPLAGVILTGNRYGLGAGADIGELMRGGRSELEELIDRGHEVLSAIEGSQYPWIAVVDGYALGGIYELALACRGIVATPRSTIGFPEIKLNIFPGLGGTQRMPRRSGLVNADDPAGDAGFTAVLTGKNFRAAAAAKIKMVDALVPEGSDATDFATGILRNDLGLLDRPRPSNLDAAESLRPMVAELVARATMGRDNPRAPWVAMDVMIKGAAMPLDRALRLERDEFLKVASSAEGKAGMRFFFTQQSTGKPPGKLAGKAKDIKKVGVDGADGYMGNAIAYLALEAGYEVVAHVPIARFAASVADKLRAKYARSVSKGRISEQEVEAKVAGVAVTTEPSSLFDCDLVVEARAEDREIKSEFYRQLGSGMPKDAIVASNSSSMGPAMLGAEFAAGGGQGSRFVNLHFFSPAENPRMQLVEIVSADDTDDEAVASAHAFVKRIGKTPLLLHDGSVGFLVNAGLAAYFGAAETLYREGTPVEAIDAALRASVFPMGPFELGDQAGLDIAAGLVDSIAAVEPPEVEPLVWKMRELGRLGVKSGAGYYDYSEGRATSSWEGLAALAGKRGTKAAGADEIVARCLRPLYDKAAELLDRGIVSGEAEADMAFVLGMGFAMHLGGPLFYGRQQGW